MQVLKKRSGTFRFWSLAEALRWRMSQGATITGAFAELRSLGESGAAEATGILAGWHPDRPNKEIVPYRWGVDPPTDRSPTTPGLAAIPADEWNDLAVAVGSDGLPTSGLDYVSAPGFAAWRAVQFDQDGLFQAWKTLRKPSRDADGARAAYAMRVAEYRAAGRAPPRNTTKPGEEGDEEWAKELGIPRPTIMAWRKAEGVKGSVGRPVTRQENSAEK